jgi:hypothetical protein
VLLALTFTACGGHALAPGGGEGGAGGVCALEPEGSFVIHVHNAGMGPIVLDLVCGQGFPIDLDTPVGTLNVSPAGGDFCAFTCDRIFAGHVTPGACSDCGPGVTKTLAAGDTFDYAWDRRVYSPREAEPPCSKTTGNCAFGSAVAPTAAQTGALTTCPAAVRQTGSCLASTTTQFTIDTTGTDATIDVP